MNTDNPKVRVISLEEAGKMNKNNVAYFTLTDGSVAVVKKDEQIPHKIQQDYSNYNQINNNNNIQSKNNINPNYSLCKIKNSYQNNNNININNGYQIIEAIPVKFCQNPNIRSYSQPEPLYVQPYLNPEAICADLESDNYDNDYIGTNQNRAFNQRKMY